MTRSRLRVLFCILIFAVVAGEVGLELARNYWPDISSEGQIRNLQSVWVSQRREAAVNLSRAGEGNQRVVPALLKALSDPDTEVRLNAMTSLEAFPDKVKAAHPMLGEMLLRDPDSSVRCGTARLLGRIRSLEALKALTTALDDPDPAVVIEATRAVGLLGPAVASQSTVDKLMAGLKTGRTEEQREAAAGSLIAIASENEQAARALAGAAAADPSTLVRLCALGGMAKPRFPFQLPTLIAALDDSTPQVCLSAGTSLAFMGLSDDRIIPALCRAARKADDATREGMSQVMGQLSLKSLDSSAPDAGLGSRCVTAVVALRKLVESRGAAARPEAVTVLGRFISAYNRSRYPGLLEPARAALDGLIARIEDEGEEPSLRVHCMNEWPLARLMDQLRTRRGVATAPGSSILDRKDELHAPATWITALAKVLCDPAAVVRTRSVEILTGSLKEPGADGSFREAWHKQVPVVVEATRCEDVRVRDGAWAILTLLGPEARQVLLPLRSLASDTHDAAVRKAATVAIKSISSVEELKASDPAARVAACEELGKLDWRAASAFPDLIGALKDPQVSVRLAAAGALQALGTAAGDLVTPLATALTAESDGTVRAAILNALEAIAPGTRPVLDVHQNGMHDPDPRVRKASATFQKVPEDESLVVCLIAALGDASDDVRLAAAHGLSEIMFENSKVIPALVKSLGDETQRKAVLEALDEHLEKVSDRADFGRVQAKIPELRATLGLAIPALRQALAFKNDEVTTLVYALLGRIAGFSRLSRTADLHDSIEPAVGVFLGALDDGNPVLRQQVLGRLGSIAIHRTEIVKAVLADLERPDLSEEELQPALAALAVQASVADADTDLREPLIAAIPLIAKALDSPSTMIRGAAVQVLGHIGVEARPALEKLRKMADHDSQSSVRRDAANAVKAINGISKMPPTSPRPGSVPRPRGDL